MILEHTLLGLILLLTIIISIGIAGATVEMLLRLQARALVPSSSQSNRKELVEKNSSS